MLIEILVCISVVVFFASNRNGESLFVAKLAPILSGVGLTIGEYLLMSRFGLFATGYVYALGNEEPLHLVALKPSMLQLT